ncbi:MAG TPA: pantoate--beta-alanine ligase [Acidimicrobiales bacterium]|nr:pantoate--beta-alanine ligase [Acidimicrobiales bacterium]
MDRLADVASWRAYAARQRAHGRRVGLVPTMGALHEGHVALFRAAREAGDVVVATSFVNPRQFNDDSDLAAYPRDPAGDVALAEGLVDALVEPTLSEMWPDYPHATATTVSVAGIGDVLEGAGRPGHFAGVASVVAKLFVITGPCRAYFGEKDYQQLVVVRRMVDDLAFDVEVVGSPIVRDASGLAVSSRNVRLSQPGRARAVGLARAVAHAAKRAAPASQLRREMIETLDAAGVEVAYAEVVGPKTLEPTSDDESGERRALVAGVVEGVRLIDNGPVTVTTKGV